MSRTPLKSPLLRLLEERGLLYQCSALDHLDDITSKKSIKAYIGFDATANSLHVGSLIQILILKYLQECGHTPFIILGAGTTMIGDPSGKDEARKILSEETIQQNVKGISKVLKKFLRFNGENAIQILNNAHWLSQLNYLEFLRNYGRLFTINRMLTYESVRARLDREQPLTFLEFNYMLLQAFDFLYLNKKHDISLQIGGSDQWGNIINGVELIRKDQNKEAFALTTPLVTKSDGSKMGKTNQGAVWLDEDLFSSWDFYQYFRNTDDADVIKYLKLFTLIPMEQINELSNLAGHEINEAKKLLAFEMTKLCHGEQLAQQHQDTAINVFEKNLTDDNLPTFNTALKPNEVISLVELLKNINFTQSNSEGKRLISSGAIKLDNIPCINVNKNLSYSDLNNKKMKISLGKRKHILVIQ